eukprot:4769146-Amphidinium_carterae.1
MKSHQSLWRDGTANVSNFGCAGALVTHVLPNNSLLEVVEYNMFCREIDIGTSQQGPPKNQLKAHE